MVSEGGRQVFKLRNWVLGTGIREAEDEESKGNEQTKGEDGPDQGDNCSDEC